MTEREYPVDAVIVMVGDTFRRAPETQPFRCTPTNGGPGRTYHMVTSAPDGGGSDMHVHTLRELGKGLVSLFDDPPVSNIPVAVVMSLKVFEQLCVAAGHPTPADAHPEPRPAPTRQEPVEDEEDEEDEDLDCSYFEDDYYGDVEDLDEL